LDRERQEFFETRVTGHTEIWASLRVIVGLLADNDLPTAQSILDAAAITVPTGDLKNGVYDEAGNHYQLPDYIISDPQNLVLDQHDLKGETSLKATDDDEELERKKEKGKAVFSTLDSVNVKARLSDSGGFDVVVSIGKDQTVRTLVRRVQEEANVRLFSPCLCFNSSITIKIMGKGRIRIAYMGKMLKDGQTLKAQGWHEGHVVNALVFE